MTPELLGPYALLAGCLIALGVLWREHLKADADDRAQRDVALAGWREQTTATNRLAAAIEQRNARDAKAARKDDG